MVMPLIGFVQTLVEDPDDLTSRLVFRDWLSDQDDPALRARGELLAIQDELAAWVPDLQRRTSLQRREQELIGDFRAAWLGPLTDFDHRFERGLVHLTLSVEEFLDPAFAAHAIELFQRGWVRTVRLTDWEPTWLADLAAAQHLEAVAALDLRSAGLEDRGVRGLAASPHLGRLRALDLSNNHLSDGALRSLGKAPWAEQLTILALRGNRLKGDHFDALLKPFLSLRILSLEGNPLGEVGYERWQTWQVAHTSPPASGVRPLERQTWPAAPAQQPRRLFNSLGMAFALIPSGTFLMGSPDSEPDRKTDQPDEGPQHPVTISRPFYFGVFPVTQREYQAVTGENPSAFHARNQGGPDHPVEQVNWEQARAFCRRLSLLPEEASAGRVYRLPSEAEWEYACRAGTTTPFWWGNRASAADANFDGNHPYNNAPRGVYLQRTTPVGSYPANPFGLYDTHGNVWEWCADWYDEKYYSSSPQVDPPGSAHDGRRSSRGGSWWDMGSRCRSAFRDYWYGAFYSASKIGLRVVLTLPEQGVTGGLP